MEAYSETAIDHIKGDTHCSVSTGEQAVRNRLAKLAERYPDDVKLVSNNADGSVYYHIPFKWVKLSPPRKVEMTDEKRVALANRMRAMREKSKTP